MAKRKVENTRTPLLKEYSAYSKQIALYELIRTKENRALAGDMYYDRSIVCSSIAQTYFEEDDYKQASLFFRKASSDAYDALRKYRNCQGLSKNIKACERQLKEYESNRNFVNLTRTQHLALQKEKSPSVIPLQPPENSTKRQPNGSGSGLLTNSLFAAAVMAESASVVMRSPSAQETLDFIAVPARTS